MTVQCIFAGQLTIPRTICSTTVAKKRKGHLKLCRVKSLKPPKIYHNYVPGHALGIPGLKGRIISTFNSVWVCSIIYHKLFSYECMAFRFATNT